MTKDNLTFAEETVQKHIEYCNAIEDGFKEAKGDFPFEVGDVIYSDCQPNRIIGIVFGFVYCPITKQNRAVLGVNCDVSFNVSRIATNKEETAFNVFTNDLNPVEARYCALL